MADSQLCNACGKPNRKQARFCGYCGRPLQDAARKKEDSSSEPPQKSPGGGTMKSLSSTIFMVALLGLLVYTNPTLESYESFLHQQILEDADRQGDALSKTFGYFFGGFASSLITRMTIRKDYILWSTYETMMGDEHLRVLGILKNFFILEQPRSTKAHN